MRYQPLIDIIIFLGNNPGWALALAVAIILANMLAFHILWRKLKENETFKYEFITIIAHKFRTPLSEIKWLIESLLSNEEDAYKRESLSEIQKANEKLIGMTGTMIELTDDKRSSRSSYVIEKTDLCDFVRVIGDAAKQQFHGKNIFFSVLCGKEPVYADIDKPRIEFAVQVLLDNALTYTPPGQKVEVGVARVGRKAVIAVRDGGIGIDPGDMKKIFDKFFRGEKARSIDTEGFGVGLYLAMSIVKRHKGKMRVISDGIGKGSLFQIILPCA